MSERLPNHPEKIVLDQDFLNSPRGSERFWQRLNWKRATVMGTGYLLLLTAGLGVLSGVELLGGYHNLINKLPEAGAFVLGATALLSAPWLFTSRRLKEDIKVPWTMAYKSAFSEEFFKGLKKRMLGGFLGGLVAAVPYAVILNTGHLDIAFLTMAGGVGIGSGIGWWKSLGDLQQSR